jgi:predicted NAD-dependent protein-ADP-ribosyltransferase YbiA (DUF1768 family)
MWHVQARGFCVFEFQQKQFSKYYRHPYRMSGYAFNTSMKEWVHTTLIKFSDDLCINSEDEVHKIILEAHNFYKLDTGFHTFPDKNS